MKMKIKTTCPNCGKEIYYKNIFDWIFSNPFHTWTKRYVKCPHCGVRSAMKREKNYD